MQELSKKSKENNQFSKRFWKGFWMCIGAGAIIAASLGALALLTYYQVKYE